MEFRLLPLVISLVAGCYFAVKMGEKAEAGDVAMTVGYAALTLWFGLFAVGTGIMTAVD